MGGTEGDQRKKWISLRNRNTDDLGAKAEIGPCHVWKEEWVGRSGGILPLLASATLKQQIGLRAWNKE